MLRSDDLHHRSSLVVTCGRYFLAADWSNICALGGVHIGISRLESDDLHHIDLLQPMDETWRYFTADGSQHMCTRGCAYECMRADNHGLSCRENWRDCMHSLTISHLWYRNPHWSMHEYSGLLCWKRCLCVCCRMLQLQSLLWSSTLSKCEL